MSYARHLTRSALRDLERKLREEGGAEDPSETILGNEPGDEEHADRLEAFVYHHLGELASRTDTNPDDRVATIRELVDAALDHEEDDLTPLLELEKHSGAPYLAVRKRLDRLNRRDLVAKIPRDDPPREGTVVYHR